VLWSRRAADEAMSRLSYEEAARLYRQALECGSGLAAMNERMWARFGASMGIAWFGLGLASVLVVPRPPGIDESTSTIAAYFNANHGRIPLSAILGALAGVAFLWFAGHLRRLLQRVDGAEAFSSIVFASGVVFAVFTALRPLPYATLAMLSQQSEAGSTGAVTRALYDVHTLFDGVIGVMAALFFATAGIAITRGELARPWLGWFGLLAAVVALAGGIARFYTTSASALAEGLGLASIITVGLWLLIASFVMWSRPEVDRTASVRTVLTH
jgi:Domain of unknown function (DUF4386)